MALVYAINEQRIMLPQFVQWNNKSAYSLQNKPESTSPAAKMAAAISWLQNDGWCYTYFYTKQPKTLNNESANKALWLGSGTKAYGLGLGTK